MFTVKKKPLTPNAIWDVESNKPLCKFVKGELKTNDAALVKKLAAMGHTVSGEADATATEQIEQVKPQKEEAPTGEESQADEPEQESTGEADATAPAAATTTKRRSRK